MYHETSERFTHNILVIAVAQLPPITANFIFSVISILSLVKVLKIVLIKQEELLQSLVFWAS
jgi:hypothetical protein